MEEEKPDSYSETNTESTRPKTNSENVENNKSSENIDMNIESEERITTLKNAFTKFLSEHTIYEAIPEDMKILVFNDELLIKDSIEAMIKEDIYCGLLYNSQQNKHSGIFTIRDVLGLLLIGYKKLCLFLNTEKNINSYEKLKEKENLDKFFATFDNTDNNDDFTNLILTENLDNKQNDNNGMDIEEENNNNNNEDNNAINKNEDFEVKEEDAKAYNDVIKDFNHFISLFENITLQSFIDLFHIKDNLISLYSDSNLEECIKTIQKNNIHRLIVNDKKTNNLAGFITYETVFEYFIENYYSAMTEFHIPLKQINIVVNNVIKQT